MALNKYLYVHFFVMTKTILIIGCATLVLIWVNLWISVKIIAYLNSKGHKAGLFKNRMYVKGKIFKYLPLYKKVSKETDGKVGILYYSFYATFLLFILLLIIGINLVS